MGTPSARTFGFELEYASGATKVAAHLYGSGLSKSDYLHGYHCSCDQCAVVERHGVKPPDIHCQTDSTADGEFITRVLSDWDDFRLIAEGLSEAGTAVGATTGPRCGLHVHVGQRTDGVADEHNSVVPQAYLAYERYFTEIIAPGRSQQKRDMNTTLMQAFRNYVVDGYAGVRPDSWLDIGRPALYAHLLGVIQRDRHVDLNFNTRLGTWEFRVFNATNSAWRMELAARMAVAFVQAAPALGRLVEASVKGSTAWPDGCDSPWGEIARPAWSLLPAPHPTKRPVVSMAAFIDCLSTVDPALRPLIERQRSYMRARYAKMVA